MKKYIDTFLKTFLFANVAFLLVAAGVKYNLNLTYAFLQLEVGALLFSLFVALGLRVLLTAKGNAILHAVAGFVLILPAVAVTRAVFSLAVFRFTFVVYALAAVAAVAYAAAVVVLSARAKRQAAALNALLDDRRSSEKAE